MFPIFFSKVKEDFIDERKDISRAGLQGAPDLNTTAVRARTEKSSSETRGGSFPGDSGT